MRYMGLDLNLLYALQVLIEERSVSSAARRIHMSQPAMSGALARIRDSLGDEILVPHGKRMVPTAHAQALAPLIAEILRGVEKLVVTSTKFDPATSTRHFRICATDYIISVLITPLLILLAQEAPGIGLEIVAPGDTLSTGLERGEYDLLFTPALYAVQTHPAENVFTESHVVAGWDQNPYFGEPTSEAAFLARGHIIVEFGRTRAPSFAELTLASLGYQRKVEVIAPSFGAVPVMLPNTMRLAIMHARLAEIFRKTLPLALAPMPFEFPPMQEVVQYHAARATDVGLRWLLDRALEVARQIPLPDVVDRQASGPG